MASVHALEGIIQEGEGEGGNYFKYCSWKCNQFFKIFFLAKMSPFYQREQFLPTVKF